jgi:hypothetical protein
MAIAILPATRCVTQFLQRDSMALGTEGAACPVVGVLSILIPLNVCKIR